MAINIGGDYSTQVATQKSADILNKLVEEVKKPWYKKPEVCFSLVAVITGLILLIIELWKKNQ